MRAAEIKGRLNALRARGPEKGPRLTRISVARLAGFKDFDVKFDNAFLAICGGTGNGKSTLLLTIYGALQPVNEGEALFRNGRPSGFEVEASIDAPEGSYSEKRDFTADLVFSAGYERGVFLETIDDRTELSRRSAVTDIEALKEGVDSFDIDPGALDFLRLICRKAYSRVSVYETELEGDSFYPHFEVEEPALSYSSEDMGSGEHSAFYLAWRLSTAPLGSVVLIEEPEALLPPSAHEQMCAMISHFAQTRGLLPIFTTHSTGIVEFLDDGDLISLSRVGSETILPLTTEAKSRVLSKLGLLPSRIMLALVEDEVGSAVLEELLEQFGFSQVLATEIAACEEGAGGVKKILDLLPRAEPSPAILGFLDGDMEKEASRWSCKSRLMFLPISRAPEVEFLESIEREPGRFGERISRAGDRVIRALEQTQGMDHHDRFRDVARRLGLEFRSFTRAAFNHYLIVAGKENQAATFAKALASAVRVSPPDLA